MIQMRSDENDRRKEMSINRINANLNEFQLTEFQIYILTYGTEWITATIFAYTHN